MTHAAVKKGLKDVATAILTPFDEEGEIRHDALAENARRIYDEGIRMVFACANVSEYHSLSHAERIAITETSVEALPEDTTVLAGAGGSTATTVDLATEFESIGVDAIMVMPPHHTYQHERGLLEYYTSVGDTVEIPLVPYLRGFDPSVEFIADLTRLDAVAGVKWTLEDIPKFTESVEMGSDDVVWINGLGEPYAISLYAEGAEGLSSGIGNFEPIVGLALFEALENGNMRRARKIRDAAVPFMNFRDTSGANNTLAAANSIPGLKAGLEFAGGSGGHVREPLVDLSEEDYERARDLYEDLAAFIEAKL